MKPTRVLQPSLAARRKEFARIVTVVHVLQERGPALGVYINPSAPVGTQTFISQFLNDSIDACNRTLGLVSTIGDARTRFHLHRVCASACRLQHAFKLTPPNLTTRVAERFDRAQLRYYARSNNIPVTSSSPAVHQIRLPLRSGGHGFTPIAPLHFSSYAASLISADAVRQSFETADTGAALTTRTHIEADKWILEFCRRLHTSFLDEYGCVKEPLRAEDLAPTACNTQNILYKAWCESTELFYWKNDEWERFPNPSSHPPDDVRRRVRYQALVKTPACHFIAAHPKCVNKTSDAMWSIMLRRHLGVKVFDDTVPLRCTECNATMDALGDHASDMCNTGLGWVNRHNAVVRVLGGGLFKAAGASVQYEMKYLVPDLDARPADILVSPVQIPGEAPQRLPIAYDITVVSPFSQDRLRAAAKDPAAAANDAERRKNRDLGQKLAAVPAPAPPPHLSPNASIQSRLGWGFSPLAFDSLGAPAKTTADVIEKYTNLVAARRGRSPGSIRYTLYQRLSFAIWSTCASSIIGRSPQHCDADTQLQV